MRKSLLVAGVAAMLAVPAAAHGAKVQVVLYDPVYSPSVKYLQYRADAGEENHVAISSISAKKRTFRVIDQGAPLTTGAGCTLVSDHEATCRGFGWAEVEMGDLNDSYRVRTQLASVVKAGPGDDSVISAGAPDTLDGGGGNDTLLAGAKDDVVTDGDRPFTGVGPDTLDGGPGQDRVDYANREAPASIDLNVQGPQGEPGEGDVLTGFEDAGVHSTGDRLIGDGGDNVLQAFGSHAVVRGRGGNDSLEAEWEGPDVVAGGSGNDELRLSTAFVDGTTTLPDKVSCGSGRDLVSFPPEDQFIPLDCEFVDYDSFEDPIYALRGKLATTRSQVVKVVPHACGRLDVRGRRCRVTWAIRERAPSRGTRGPSLARRLVSWPRNADGPSVVLRLTPAGRRILKRRHGLDARVGILRGNRITEGFVMRLELAAEP